MSSVHPNFEQLNDLLDERVSGEDRRLLEAHLASCEICRSEWEQLKGTRDLLRQAMITAADVPADVQRRVVAAIEHESKARVGRAWQLAAGLAAAAVLVLAIVLIPRWKKDLPSAAVEDYRSIAAGDIPLELRTKDATRLQQWFDQRLDFSSRVFDLNMMGYELVGGRIDSMGPHRSALFVYRHTGGAVVVCEMYQGRTEELPAGAERREHNGIEFFIFQRDGATAVFWQEGAVVCVLASEAPREEVVSLAFAKAMRPAAL